MAIAASLVALALLGGDPVPTEQEGAVETGEQIKCEMQMTTVEGLGWRSAAYPKLRAVGQQGASMIWTADRSLKPAFDPTGDGKVSGVKAPAVLTFKDAKGTIQQRGPFHYIGDVERIADGPINGATQLRFAPKGATVEIGFATDFSARRLDQGTLAKVKVTETHIGSIHRLGVTEYIYPPQEEASTALTPVGKQLFQQFVKADAATVSAPLMIPEVASAEVAGEWLVPNDSILIISLGIDTVITPEGKTVTQERLAIYDFARPSDTARTAQVTTPTTNAPKTTSTPAVVPPAARVVDTDKALALASMAASITSSGLSMPRVPDRSLPEGVDADGHVFDLPPLPEAYASADLNQIKPGSPLASPQSAPVLTARSTQSHFDPALARTSLEAIPESEVANLSYNVSTPPAPVANLASVIESFLRKGIETRSDRDFGFVPTLLSRFAPCDDVNCPAVNCPFAAEGCDEQNQPANPAAAKVEMGVSVRDGKGLCVYNAEEDLIAALKTPGQTEVKYIPLGGNMSLEIQAKVISQPVKNASTARSIKK